MVPILIGKGVDVIVGKGNVDFPALLKICIVIAVTVLISALFQWITSLSTNKLSYNTIRDIRADYFEKLNSVPLKFIDNSSKGELIGRAVNDIETISDRFTARLYSAFQRRCNYSRNADFYAFYQR